jgi:hypothetical protein
MEVPFTTEKVPVIPVEAFRMVNVWPIVGLKLLMSAMFRVPVRAPVPVMLS